MQVLPVAGLQANEVAVVANGSCYDYSSSTVVANRDYSFTSCWILKHHSLTNTQCGYSQDEGLQRFLQLMHVYRIYIIPIVYKHLQKTMHIYTLCCRHREETMGIILI